MTLLLRQSWNEPHSSLVPTTRHQVRRSISNLVPGISIERLDDMELVASELLANAVLYARPPLAIEVSVDPRFVRLEVQDSSPDLLPPPPPQAALAETGRGLMLAALLSDRWGWRVDPETKSVWVEWDR
jgi:anti-sigma regulatory factor (Ser/Thr protein kinase)